MPAGSVGQQHRNFINARCGHQLEELFLVESVVILFNTIFPECRYVPL